MTRSLGAAGGRGGFLGRTDFWCIFFNRFGTLLSYGFPASHVRAPVLSASCTTPTWDTHVVRVATGPLHDTRHSPGPGPSPEPEGFREGLHRVSFQNKNILPMGECHQLANRVYGARGPAWAQGPKPRKAKSHQKPKAKSDQKPKGIKAEKATKSQAPSKAKNNKKQKATKSQKAPKANKS